MKNIIILILTVIPTLLIGQSKNYNFEPIDKLGWMMTNFSEPENITELDSGQVKYLLTLNKKGQVKKVEVLSSTFRTESETAWRKEIKKLIFTRQKPQQGQLEYKGTLFIESRHCNSKAKEFGTD